MSKFTGSITDVILKEINKINFYSKDFISELNIQFRNLKSKILIKTNDQIGDSLDNKIAELVEQYLTDKLDLIDSETSAITSNILKNEITAEKISENEVECKINTLIGIFIDYIFPNTFYFFIK